MNDQRTHRFCIASHAASMAMSRHILTLLMTKGVISRSEAAGVFTASADEVRSGTEDDPAADIGEAVARGLETQAGWLLGQGQQ
jgi:hypothetical protein